MNLQRKENVFQYGMIDIVKFLCAVLIVIAHYVTENADGRVNALIEYGVSLYVIVVPFFFCCTGFLLFKKIFAEFDASKRMLSFYCRRILVMYAGWSSVYILFKVATWLRFGVAKEEIFRYLLHAVSYSTYKTLWFLPALCIGICLSYVFFRRVGLKRAMIFALLFYLIGALGVSYNFIVKNSVVASNILDLYNYIFVSTRNGFFNGFPFIMLGGYVAYEDKNGKQQKTIRNVLMTVLFGVAFIAEAFILKFKFNAPNVNTLLFLIPFTYYLIRLCISFSIQSGRTLKWMRKMSTTIFLCQRIFLTALPTLLPNSLFAFALSGNPYIGVVFILSVTVIMAEVLIILSSRYKLFSILC